MTKQQVDLIPKKTLTTIKEILEPLSHDSSEAAIIFLVDQIQEMFRELSEMRSSSMNEALKVLTRRESNLLHKLNELFPESKQQTEDVFLLMKEALKTQFDRQKGKKYL